MNEEKHNCDDFICLDCEKCMKCNIKDCLWIASDTD